VLILHTYDSKGKRKDVLRLPLWHPLTGEWLVPLEEERLEMARAKAGAAKMWEYQRRYIVRLAATRMTL
jgi:hypothetical protein